MTARKPPSSRKRASGIPEEDQALWDLVASRLEPAKGKPRVLDVDMQDNDTQRGRPPSSFIPVTPGLNGAGQRDGAKRTAPVPGRSDVGVRSNAVSRPPPPEPQPVVLERKRARRLARGADAIEARLDLHGMTQEDAHSALTGFIRRCHAAGLRTVLVITGKGGAGRERGGDNSSGHYGDHWHGDHWLRPRGVLKRNVPIWLSQPELGLLVVSFSTAHVRHGGEGAIYVQLRVKR